MFPQRLKLARKKIGFSLEQLASEVNVSKQAISKYENGKMMPGSDVLLRLKHALSVSLDYLTGSQVVALESVQFRKHSSTTAKDRALAEVVVTETMEKYLAIEAILDIKLPTDSVAGVCGRAGSFEDAERYADRLRAHWNLGNDPIPSVARLLERCGFKLVQTDLPDTIHALTCNVRLNDGCLDSQVIVLGNGGGIERRRFNLAHELGHKVILDVKGSDSPKLERLIDCFAGAFLIPAGHLRQMVGDDRHGINYGELVRLKHVYGVSASAMLIRLKQVGILPAKYVDSLFRRSQKVREWRKKEPEPAAQGCFNEQPQMFEFLVWRALSEQLMHPLRGAKLMGVPLSEVEKEIRSWPRSD